MEIRTMLPTDWESVKRIYESGIATGVATFEDAAPGWERWNSDHFSHSRLVAVEHDEVWGWTALSPVTDRCVYQGVAEVSVYVHTDHRNEGVGQQLLEAVVAESERNGIWTLQSAIFPENTSSLALHQRVGFRLIGYREKVAKKKTVWKDNLLLEKRSRSVGID